MKDKAINIAIERIQISIGRKLTDEERDLIQLTLSILFVEGRTEALQKIKEEL